MNDPANAGNACRSEILVVSFGTSYPDTRRKTIGAIEDDIENAFGDSFDVGRAFTSQMIINAIHRKEGIRVDNVTEALERAVSSGVETLIVQPTHMMKGQEYAKLCGMAAGYSDSFSRVVIGDPLLTTDEDFNKAADALYQADCVRTDGSTAVVLMGHGTAASSNEVYMRMQSILSGRGMSNYYVGTVEASPTLADMINEVKSGDYTRVILRPLMVVAGDHALSDMASHDNPDSWYSQFRTAGYEVETIIEGLGEIPAIREIYADHIRAALCKPETDDSNIL